MTVVWLKGSMLNLLTSVSVLGILMVLIVPVVPMQGSHTVVLPSPHDMKTAALVASSPTTPAIPGTPSVAYTLDLCTNHLYSGNALPTNCPKVKPYSAAYDNGKGEVFVTDSGSNNVTVISGTTNTIVANVTVGSRPWGLAYDSGKGEVFVTDFGSNNVTVISDVTNTVVATIPVGTGPIGVAYDSGRGEVFVTDFGSNNVAVISDTTNTVTATVLVGSGPAGATYDSGKGEVFVTGSASNNVSVISDTTNTVVATIPVGSKPWGLAYDSGRGEVFVTDSICEGSSPCGHGNVSVISDATNSVVATVPVGINPPSVAYVNLNSEVFVVDWGTSVTGGNVSVISDTSDTVAATIPVGSYPYGVTYDMSNGYVYVINSGQGTISIITTGPAPSTYPVSFSESGLPAGTSWSVTLAGNTLSSTTGTIGFNEPNATYPFTVGAVAGYTANITSGSVTINGASKTISITFTKSGTGATYGVTFSESGLPSGTSWSVTLGGSTQSGTGNIVFTEPNGTYSFSVGAIAGYTVSPSSGPVKVNGNAVSQAVTFTALPSGQYSVILSESGLPAGTNWSVTMGTSTHSSTASTISFVEVNGTYHYTVGSITGYTSSPSSGNVTVNGVAKTVSITFAKASTGTTYTVTFTESGLPSGTNWSVTLNCCTSKSSTTATITFQEPNGSYSFSVGSVNGYTVSPLSGSVKVNGGPASQSVTFMSSSGKTNQTTGFLGLPGYDGYIIVGVVLAVVIVAAALVLMRKGKRGQPAPPPYPPQTWQQPPAQAPSPGYPQQGWQQSPPPTNPQPWAPPPPP